LSEPHSLLFEAGGVYLYWWLLLW